jgi:hypothetical protein
LILREHNTIWLGKNNDNRIDRGSSPSPGSQQRRPPSQTFRNSFGDKACLEEPVDVRVASGVTLKRFDEDDGRNDRRPQLSSAEGFDDRHCSPRPFGEA